MKPQTEDGINFEMHNNTVRFLTMDEVIQAGDFIRDIYESPMYSQDGGWDTTYKNEKWRGTMWHKAEEELPGWIGSTYRDYLNFCYNDVDIEPDEYELYFRMGHEIIRVVKEEEK